MPPKNTKTSSFPFDGGLDMVTSPLMLKPGQLIGCKNYEIANTGGYRRILGFEQTDGRGLASQAQYTALGFDSGIGMNAGDVVVGSISAASGVVLETVSGATGVVYLYVSTGAFVLNDLLVRSSVSRGRVTTLFDAGAGIDIYSEHLRVTKLAVEYHRTLIQEVPGDGPILGVAYLKDIVYAFRDNADHTAARMYKSTPTGWEQVHTPTLAPGGRYWCINYNFSGHAGSMKMYGCDGVNKAFMFDGEVFTQLTTGMAYDTPILIAAHRNHLFLGFRGGSVQHSGIAEPTSWSAVLGAAELAIGDELTAFLPTAGATLLLFSKNTVQVLYGSGQETWELKQLSPTTGAVMGSAQSTAAPIFVSDFGISMIGQADVFGDFQANTISMPVQKIVDNYRTLIVGSTVLKSKNQYRLFFSNGEILVMTFAGDRVRGYTMSDYGVPIRCVSDTGRSDSDSEVENDVFFGSDDGFVYKMDSGPSFAGQEIQAILRIPPNHLGMPRVKKFFRLMIIEVESVSGTPATIFFKPDFGLFSADPVEATQEEITTAVQGADWDDGFWDEFFWSTDNSSGTFYEIRPEGVGLGLGGLIYSSSNDQDPHTIRSGLIHYSLRGMQR